jgi:hypothetical protein
MRPLSFACLVLATSAVACSAGTSTPAGSTSDAGPTQGHDGGSTSTEAGGAADGGTTADLAVNGTFDEGTSGWFRFSARYGVLSDTIGWVSDDGNPPGALRVIATGNSVGGRPADAATCIAARGASLFHVSFDARVANGTLQGTCLAIANWSTDATCEATPSAQAIGDSFAVGTSWTHVDVTVGRSPKASGMPSFVFMLGCSMTDDTGELRLDNVSVVPVDL